MLRVIIIALTVSLIVPGPLLHAWQEPAAVYICPMDAEVKASAPGSCPKCGMALRFKAAGTEPARNASADRQEGRVDRPRIPDVTVFDQDGRKLRFYTDLVKGRTVAINFIFTTCTTICPPLAATFRRVQLGLGERAGRDVQLISVSVDPAVDIPERLKSFAGKFQAGPGWTLVTGGVGDIDKLLERLGAAVSDKTNHTPMVLVGNDTLGLWTRAYGLAHSSKLLRVITDVADTKSPAASTPAH